jgi:uncharacterized phage-associated protein
VLYWRQARDAHTCGRHVGALKSDQAPEEKVRMSAAEAAVTFRGTSAAVIQVLIAARANGVVINRTKLAKLLYLADLRAVEEDLPPGSDVEWRWRHYGPYSDILRAVEEDLEAAGVVEVARTKNYYGGSEIRLRLHAADPRIEIDRGFANIIDEIMRTYGRLSATQLKDLTYQTPPMQAAQRIGQRELRLDLAGGNPYPDLAPPLARLRVIAEEFPLPEDEPGAIDELVAEVDDWSQLRRAATSTILDE